MKKIFTLIAFLAVSLCSMAQTQHVYEWKNGSVTIRTTSEIDSLTFSIPEDAVSFTTGNPSVLTECSMTASFSLSSVLSITNAESTTEQGICFSTENKLPTIANEYVKYSTFYIGTWKVTISNLHSGMLYYYRPYLKIADSVFYGPVKNFTTLGDYVEIPECALDLGLPSGTLWADRNVGADSPEAYGDYFAWGETSPKKNYSFSTYKWSLGSYDDFTKYCTNSYYGTIDNNNVLDSSDDASTVNIGHEWRMPTYDELSELYSECTWVWTTQNATNGYKVTGPNCNSIFLPAAGYYDGTRLYNADSFGFYWSASLGESYPDIALSLLIYSDGHDIRNSFRCMGYTVRAVVR